MLINSAFRIIKSHESDDEYDARTKFRLTSYASYIVIAPITGLVVKQLTTVRSLKSFAFFAGAVIVGLAIAFVTQSYFKTLIS